MQEIFVEELEQDDKSQLQLRLIAGATGLKKKIRSPYTQQLGLGLTGEFKYIEPYQITILGDAEISYLLKLDNEKIEVIINKISKINIPCFIISSILEIPNILLKSSEKNEIPLFLTTLEMPVLRKRIDRFLEKKFKEKVSLHGVLLDVLGVGVLLIGKSGVGKSETALELVVRGHRMVADDMVYIEKTRDNKLLGKSFDIIKNLLEIRGLGILDLKRLFGVSAIRKMKKIELVIELLAQDNQDKTEIDNKESQFFSILGVSLPFIRIPFFLGRNISTIIEVAVRDYLLKTLGYHSNEEFEKRLMNRIIKQGEKNFKSKQ